MGLIRGVNEIINVPLIVSGGMGKVEDIKLAVDSGADAAAMADVLHYKKLTFTGIRQECHDFGLHVRKMR